MRKIFLALMLSSLVLCQSFAATMSDRIEMGVSPIKHEMIVNPGQTIAKTITFYNNADIPYNLYLSSEDCRADTDYGTPKCSQKPNVDGDPIYASTWITFSGPTSFTVPPNSEYTVNFTIQAPTNAVPGGHYGAIFFNNPTVNPTDNSVTMLKRIGTLLLLTVPGDIVYNTVYGSISIGGGGGRTSGASPSINPSINSITAPRTPREWMDYASDLLDPSFSAPTLPPARPFDEAFRIPVSNSGNVHILPVGRIELYDERGLLLENIGKESVRTSEGVFVGEKVVDYLPINDEAGNVLPNTERVYTVNWRGFAYETFEGGKNVIKFASPQEYYNSAVTALGPLMPWEKYRVAPVTKEISARVYLEYAGSGSNPVPYETEMKIPLTYDSILKTPNYGVISIGLLMLTIVFFFFLWKRDDRRIDKLEEEIAFVETEMDELERAKVLAKQALAKKKNSLPKSKKPAVVREGNKAQTEGKTPKKRIAGTRKKKSDTETNV